MQKRRVRLLVTVALATTVLAATPAHADPIGVADAAPVLDQFFGFEGLRMNVSHGFGWAQTFTVGIGGKLAAIQVPVVRAPDATASFRLDVRRTHGGVPAAGNQDVLGSVLVPPTAVSSSPAYLNVDLGGFAVPIAVGDQLAIVLQSLGAVTPVQYGWLGGGTCPACGDPIYARGALFVRQDDTAAWRGDVGDAGFRTFVRTEDVAPVPEPSTLLLVSAGLVYASRRRLRSSRQRSSARTHACKPQ